MRLQLQAFYHSLHGIIWLWLSVSNQSQLADSPLHVPGGAILTNKSRVSGGATSLTINTRSKRMLLAEVIGLAAWLYS